MAAPSGGALRLESFGLACTGTCMYPGVYTLSPPVPLQAGHALVTFSARSSAADSTVRAMAQDSSGVDLAQAVHTVAQGSANHTGTLWIALPAQTAKLLLRLEVLTPNSTAVFDSIKVDWQP